VTDPEAVIREYVCRVCVGCAADRISSVERLVPGENNAIYKVEYRARKGDANQVVVRVGSTGVAARLRAEREARVLRRVGGVAGPKLYDFRAEACGVDRPVMCLEFVHGHHADLNEVDLDGLEYLGRLVRWLHVQSVDDFGDWVPGGMGFSAYVQERWQDHVVARLGAIRDPLPNLLQKRLRAAVDVAADAVEELKRLAAVAADDRLVLLHGDISGANLLWAPEPVLIDWEYARLGDPADEVAYVFTQNALTDFQQNAFWRGYSKPRPPTKASDVIERVRHWKPITLVGSILWWLDAWSRAEAATHKGQLALSLPRQPDYYLEQASERLERFQ
jgi:aminoglycoside phosphotransferase (APT) family kinase protein